MQDVINFAVNMNWMEVLGAVSLFLSGALALALIIPGNQPDAFLQSVVNFLSKFSKK